MSFSKEPLNSQIYSEGNVEPYLSINPTICVKLFDLEPYETSRYWSRKKIKKESLSIESDGKGLLAIDKEQSQKINQKINDSQNKTPIEVDIVTFERGIIYGYRMVDKTSKYNSKTLTYNNTIKKKYLLLHDSDDNKALSLNYFIHYFIQNINAPTKRTKIMNIAEKSNVNTKSNDDIEVIISKYPDFLEYIFNDKYHIIINSIKYEVSFNINVKKRNGITINGNPKYRDIQYKNIKFFIGNKKKLYLCREIFYVYKNKEGKFSYGTTKFNYDNGKFVIDNITLTLKKVSNTNSQNEEDLNLNRRSLFEKDPNISSLFELNTNLQAKKISNPLTGGVLNKILKSNSPKKIIKKSNSPKKVVKKSNPPKKIIKKSDSPKKVVKK
jgi:hypothetical protein